MVRFFVLAAAITFAATMVAGQAQAMQVQTMPAHGSLFTLVRDGCGEGYFRGDDGRCRREHEHHVGVIGEVLGVQPRDDRRVCPEGYHMGVHSGVCKLNE
jgi:hypothetical protein